MAKPGQILMRNDGTIGMTKLGGIAVFDAKGECVNCCCKPKLLGTFTTTSIDNPWDLSKWYEKHNVGTPGNVWRLTNNYMSYVPKREGTIDEYGVLTGLPPSISPTTYKYTWIFRLEVGCVRDDGTIRWPNPDQDQDDDSDYNPE